MWRLKKKVDVVVLVKKRHGGELLGISVVLVHGNHRDGWGDVNKEYTKNILFIFTFLSQLI